MEFDIEKGIAYVELSVWKHWAILVEKMIKTIHI